MSNQGKSKPVVKQNDVSKPDGDTSPQISWNDMGGAPAGVPVMLKKPDGSVVAAYFHATREMKDGRWQKTGFWTEQYGPRQPISWEPQGWVWP